MVTTNNISASLTEARLDQSGDTAYIYQKQQITFGELWQQTRSAATALHKRGFRARQQVLFIHEDSLEWPVMFHAMILIGCIPVVVNPRMSTSQVDEIKTKIKCDQILTSDKIANLDYVNETRFTDIYNYQDSDTLLILTSSGTTGSPKLIVHQHKNLQQSFEESNPYLLDKRSVILCPAKMSFMFGMIVNVIGCLTTGSCAVILRTPHDFKHIFEIINRNQITHLFAVPSLLKFLLKYKNKHMGKHVQHVYTSTEPLPTSVRETFKQRFNHELFDVYGASETFRWTIMINNQQQHCSGSLGCPGPNIVCRVVDEHGNDCGVGDIGELVVKHNTVAQGYFNDAERSSQSFCNGWYHTKDLVYKDHNNFYFYVGRTDACMKVNNQYVSSLQIEREINAIPGVVDSVVVFDRNLHDTHLVAFVVTDQTGFDIKVVQDTLGGTRHSFPKEVFLIKDIPLTPTNKKVRSLQILKDAVKL
jgi:long-chain acyl-CoA synthetase